MIRKAILSKLLKGNFKMKDLQSLPIEKEKKKLILNNKGNGGGGSSVLDDNIIYIDGADGQNNLYAYKDDSNPLQFAKGSNIVILYNKETKKVGYYRGTIFDEEFPNAKTSYDYILGGIMDNTSYKYLISLYTCMLKGSDGRELKEVMNPTYNDFTDCANAWYDFVCTNDDYKSLAQQVKGMIRITTLNEILDVSNKTFVPYSD